ncbi:MAG: CDP-alcohol phosphatidyltransferase family protein [Candidatus Cryptobacteroides sp.]
MRIAKYIPNTVTSLNLLSGVIGVTYAFEGRPDIAFILMIAASVFDFCDGLLARLLNAKSEIGKELDSLSDMVSFGVLPSLLLNRMAIEHIGTENLLCTILCATPFLIAVFSGLRLAKFNTDSRQTENFIGLATPACALFCGALAHYVHTTPDSFLVGWAGSFYAIPLLSVILSALLVCEMPMFSLKFKKGQNKNSITNKLRICFLTLCAASALLTFLVGQKFSLIFIISVLIYIIMNVINLLATPRK